MCAPSFDPRDRMTGRHPVGHGRSSPTTDQGWFNYWTDYYNRSRQLKRASQDSWNATREIWMRKLVQAREYAVRSAPGSSIMAPDLWLWNKEVRLAGEHISIWQDEKERVLE